AASFASFALSPGTAMVAGGASALNQYSEREADARMERTRRRPLPSGRVTPGEALGFGLAVSLSGLAILATINALTALLGAIALAGYPLLYTPFNRATSLSTLLPPVPAPLPP